MKQLISGGLGNEEAYIHLLIKEPDGPARQERRLTITACTLFGYLTSPSHGDWASWKRKVH